MELDSENKLEIVSLELINQGSFGKVYRGTMQTSSGVEEVAIKKIKLKNNGINGILEPILLRSLDHPFLASCYEIQSSTENLYLVQKLAPHTLNTFLKKNHLSFEEMKKIAFSLATAVRDLHSLNIVHADIKPENILMYEQTPKLTDFSLSVLKTEEKKTFEQTVCTANYRPPENFDNRNWNEKLDIWSLGCTFYYLFFKDVLFYHQAIHEPKGKIESEEGRDRCRLRCKKAFIDWEDLLRSRSVPLPPRPRGELFHLGYSKPNWNELLDTDEYHPLRQLLFQMIHPLPAERLSAAEICSHPFFSSCSFSLSFRVLQLKETNLSKAQIQRSKVFFNRYLPGKLATERLALRLYGLTTKLKVDLETTKIAACCLIAHKIHWGTIPSIFANYERSLTNGSLTTADPSLVAIVNLEKQICNSLSFRIPFAE